MNKVLIKDKAQKLDGWKVKNFSEIFNVKSSKRVMKSDWKEDGVPFYRAREVVKLSQDGFVDNELYISEELFEKFTKDSGYIKRGDLIVSAVGTLGSCYIVKENDRFYFKDASVLWLEKINETVDSKYIFYGFKSDFLINQIKNSSPGATVGTLTITKARKLKIQIPSLTEQRRIVSKLDALFAEVDASLALIDQNIAQAEALKLSVLDEELNTDSEEVKISNLLVNTKNINPKEIYKDEEFTYIDISSINKDLYRIESPKILKGSEAPSRARKEVKLRDIVFATTRPNLKNVAIVDKEYTNSIASTGFCVLRPKQDKLINSFLFYFLISNKLQDLIQPFIRGAQYPAISDRNLKGIKLATPTIETQQKIVQKLDALFAEIDALVLDYTQKRENLEALKSSLLDQAFKGEL